MTDETEEVPYHANEVQRFYYEELKWCGCGNPDDALTFLRDVLQTMHDWSEANGMGRWNEQNPEREAAKVREQELLPLDSPLALSYRYFLDALDLTEHGGSVYGSWLTEHGEAVLAMLRAHGDLEVAMDDDYPVVVE
jgi:hypothetical protein